MSKILLLILTISLGVSSLSAQQAEVMLESNSLSNPQHSLLQSTPYKIPPSIKAARLTRTIASVGCIAGLVLARIAFARGEWVESNKQWRQQPADAHADIWNDMLLGTVAVAFGWYSFKRHNQPTLAQRLEKAGEVIPSPSQSQHSSRAGKLKIFGKLCTSAVFGVCATYMGIETIKILFNDCPDKFTKFKEVVLASSAVAVGLSHAYLWGVDVYDYLRFKWRSALAGFFSVG